MKVSGIHIAGIGTAEVENVETAEAVKRGWYGAEEREQGELLSISIAGTTPAPDLAVEAARHALNQSGHAPTDFSAVFHTNVHPQGPDGWSAQHYINRNTINQPVTSIEIHNGCVGFFSTLQLATCFLNATSERTAALLTCADNFGTPAVDRWNSSKLFVLGDGGGGIVLSKRGGFAKLLSIGSASNPELEAHHRGGEKLFPPGITAGGTLNFEERMAHSHQKAVEGLLPPMGDFGSVLVDTVAETLKDADVTMGEITRVIHDGFTHDALRFIFLDPLEVEDDRGIWEYTRQVGHAGPLDQIRGLEYAWKNRLVGAGDKVLLVSGAPGMEAACAVLEIVDEGE
ncbi:ketoacyl-ACP synthase III family protein [Streptomyces sp. NBC_00243]|uniref:ketoacyl-ACP synthase III family protein n=1 Tax=Streptomyces sp. NBC_00243 TaxID=2975688 RepID=UPI002DDC84E9|nr:ketoacyl-ACP synthase III family protein [Streptomyces sp. NBC_00243]WRZ17314.1 ketoacyl-ACP synthase III family protein [Streptomyces sp. NBC_00243]